MEQTGQESEQSQTKKGCKMLLLLLASVPTEPSHMPPKELRRDKLQAIRRLTSAVAHPKKLSCRQRVRHQAMHTHLPVAGDAVCVDDCLEARGELVGDEVSGRLLVMLGQRLDHRRHLPVNNTITAAAAAAAAAM